MHPWYKPVLIAIAIGLFSLLFVWVAFCFSGYPPVLLNVTFPDRAVQLYKRIGCLISFIMTCAGAFGGLLGGSEHLGHFTSDSRKKTKHR